MKFNFRLLNVVFFLIVTAVGAGDIHMAVAENFNCDGVIRNLPCDQKQLSSEHKTKNETSKSQDSELSKKQSLFHDFDMKNVRAKREFGIRLDISPVEDFCNKEDTSLSDCQEKILRMDDRLSLLIKDVKADQAEQEKKEKESEAKKNEQSGTNVTVVQENNVIVPKRRHHNFDENADEYGGGGHSQNYGHGENPGHVGGSDSGHKPKNPRLEDSEDTPWYEKPTKKRELH